MRRRLLILTITAVLVFAFGIITSNAETSGQCGDNATWVLEDNGVLTISGNGEMYDYYDYDADVEIESPFALNEEIKSIIIQDGITSIGKNSFLHCSGLTSVSIPGSLISIRDDAFSKCSGLKTVTIPGNVKTIGARAFSKCESLETVTISEGVTTIGSENALGAFSYCSSLTSATIPGSVTYMAGHSFLYCEKLESINVAESNPNYASKDGVLYNKDFTKLLSCPGGKTSATIGESVSIIGECAFESCGKLTSIVIPSNVEEIQTAAFANCDGLLTVTVPGSISVISKNAFGSCDKLEDVRISDGVKSIDEGAFAHCEALKQIVIPESVTEIAEYGFYNSTNLQDVYYGGSEDQWNRIQLHESEREAFAKARMHYSSVGPEEECDTHIWNTFYSVDRPATCTSTGSESIHCSKCGAIKENSSRLISKKPHTFGVWVTTKKATEAAAGVSTRTCSVCGSKETKTIAQLAPTLPKIKISKPKATKKSATIKWKKPSKKNLKKIKKIEIQYSTDSSFSSGVKSKYAGAKKTSVKIKGLAKGQKYFVRIRAINGGHVSAWSAVKSVKAK